MESNLKSGTDSTSQHLAVPLTGLDCIFSQAVATARDRQSLAQNPTSMCASPTETSGSLGQCLALVSWHTQGRDPKGLPWGYLVLWLSGCPSGTHQRSTGHEELVSEVNAEKVNGTRASNSTHTDKYYREAASALKWTLGFVWFPFCCQWKSPWNHSTWQSLDCFTKVWLEERLSGNTTASQVPRHKISCPQPFLTTLGLSPCWRCLSPWRQLQYAIVRTSGKCVLPSVLSFPCCSLSSLLPSLVTSTCCGRIDYFPSLWCGKSEGCSVPHCS